MLLPIRSLSRTSMADAPCPCRQHAPGEAQRLGEVPQDQRQRGPKVYSLHAPEVECIAGLPPMSVSSCASTMPADIGFLSLRRLLLARLN
jgi:hypothetical protein